MAIKGKKKSQKKARPSRPRPVAPARPTRAPTVTQPFHRTFEGQFAAIIVALVVAGFAMFTVAANRSEDAARASDADAIRTYTTEINRLLSSVNETVREMSGAPFNTDDQAAIAGLKERAEKWIDELEKAGALASAVVAPQGLAPANRIFTEGFQAYSAAAKTYRLVPNATGKLQQELLDRAMEQRGVANEVVITGISMLDLVRSDAGMDPSELQAPGTLPPIVPTPAASPTAEPEGTGGGTGKGKGKGDG